MGITSLNNAISGLRMSQQQLDLISNNIANAGNEDYTRKILPQTGVIIQNRGAGVAGENIIRNVDMNLQRDLWTQISAVDFHSIQETYLGRVEFFHGPPDSEFSISAEIGKLQNTFAALSDSPEDRFLQSNVLDQAEDAANKINDFANYLLQLRNDTQTEIDDAVSEVNALLEEIAEMNGEVRFAQQAGRSEAEFADRRDAAIRELSQYLDLTSYQRGDGVLVVQTATGEELASDFARIVGFSPSTIGPGSSYPDDVAAITLSDFFNPNNPPADITSSALGGKIGGLIALRDETFPKQLAQLDELAHKMALRFDAQGLRLFTDTAGNVPADTPPDTGAGTAVEYVGFAVSMQVNSAVRNDPSLLVSGTYGGAVQTGSSEVLRRVTEFTFGSIEYQQILNEDTATSIDIRAAATGATTLQDWLGVRAQNDVSGAADLTAYADIADIITAGGDDVFGSGSSETDQFEITFSDPDYGGGPYTMTIDLRAVPDAGGNAAQDLVAYIQTRPDWASAVTDYGASVSVGPSGNLQINANSDIEVASAALDGLTTTGFAFLGLGPTTSEANDPYFDIQVGNDSPTRVFIEPADTEVELLAKLNAIDGVAAQIDANGFLSIRPGNDFTNPDYGGDISITGGPFTSDTAALAGTASGRTSIDDGLNIISAVFGTYSVTGGVISNNSPVVDVEYASETDNGSGINVPFRINNVGGDAGVSTDIFNATGLIDFSQKMINDHTQDLVLAQNRGADEVSLRGLLEQNYLDESAVNVDEELGFLIMVQTAYAASARVVTAVDEIFTELLNTFR